MTMSMTRPGWLRSPTNWDGRGTRTAGSPLPPNRATLTPYGPSSRPYDHEDLSKCWTWLHFAKLLGTDLTTSSMRAYHDGGPQDGQEYDDDFGGPAYVDGDEGIKLPPLDSGDDAVARERADEMYRRFSQRR